MKKTEQDTLAILEKTVAGGARCPMNDRLPGSLTPLTRAGKIRVEVFVHNFRRVTMLVGHLAGRSTQDPPRHDGMVPKPYLVSDAAGTFRNGQPVYANSTKTFRSGKTVGKPITLPFKNGKRV